VVLQDRSSTRSRWQATSERVSGFATERLARRALAQAKVDIDAGRLRHEARCTVGDLANEGWRPCAPTVRPPRSATGTGLCEPTAYWGWPPSLRPTLGRCCPEVVLGAAPFRRSDLRRTAATVALLAGVHPKVVSERHGHASQITLDRYSHVLASMQEAAADAIGRFLQSA
jgi:hypothetical protein